MVTGVETGGLVVGSLPLVLAVMQAYAEGIDVGKRAKGYRKGIKSLSVSLKTYVKIYHNDLIFVLTGLVSEVDMAAYVTNPRGDLWKQSIFDNKLKRRLGTSYDVYLDTLDEVNRLAEDCMKLLNLDAKGKARSVEPYSFSENWQRFKFTFNKSTYSEIMEQIWRAIETLHTLIFQKKEMGTWEVQYHTRIQSSPDYVVIKDGASGLYTALSSSWICSCGVNHSTILRLDSRMNDGHTVDEDRIDNGVVVCPFHVLFWFDDYPAKQVHASGITKPWTCEEAEIQITRQEPPTTRVSTVRFVDRVAESKLSKAHDAIQPIVDLCQAISELQVPPRHTCLSMPERELAEWRYNTLIYPTKTPPTDTERWSICSLRFALHEAENFPCCERLEIAVTLASSVLQLHGTPWLDDNWDTDSVYLIHREGSDSYEQPFVFRNFTQATVGSKSIVPESITGVVRNRILYALGIALIELWYRKTIPELHKVCDGPQHTGDDKRGFLTRYETATRLVRHLKGEAGEMYSEAVGRCIWCDFGRPTQSLRDREFQTAVFQNVVALLKASHDSMTTRRIY